jgi:thioredoxin reductase (NADPH)
MATPLLTSVVATRRDQTFPVLEASEIERVRPFGSERSFAEGEALQKIGDIGRGLAIVLSGKIEIVHYDNAMLPVPVATYGPGEFMGELAQLAGRPALVDAYARSQVDALIVVPDRLRALMVAEAELGERLMRALILRRVGLLETGAGGPIILGASDDGDVLRLGNFLHRNGHPYRILDPKTEPDANALIERLLIDADRLPMVICPQGQILRNPSEDELARCIGLVQPINPDRIYDVAIVGAGPAGLAAAVYAGSEGLSALVLDCRARGGQAGASARIENYLGFPTGISGGALMARAYNQAQKFGVEIAIPDEAVCLKVPAVMGTEPFVVKLFNGETVQARTVLVASGARYRRLAVPNLGEFESSSVHYWASPLEGKLCSEQEVALVGAGNSAGQATVYLASQSAKVWLLVRGPDLATSMSRYLVDRIAGLPNVEVLTRTEITGLEGEDGVLRTVRWQGPAGEEVRRPIRHLFLFIGADPNTDWLSGSGVALDRRGFVLTGAELNRGHQLETSREGIFAIGDVRAGSMKRVAAAVGEGAQVVAAVHGRLAALTANAPAARLSEPHKVTTSSNARADRPKKTTHLIV